MGGRSIPAMSATLVSNDPRTGRPVGSVELTPVEEVPEIVARSRKAFADWSGLSHRERRSHLQAFKQLVLARGEEVANLVTSETGKPLTEAYGNDVVTALSVMDHYIRNGERYLQPRRGKSWPFITTEGWTEFHPRGVAGIITPWNYPFFLPMIPIVSALTAGCTVIFKPSELTPLTGKLLGDLADEAGLPADVLQVIQGRGDVGSALIASGVDVVAFTGSTRVGKLVAAEVAKRLTPAILELGGKDAMVVLDDADLARTASAAVWGAMLNAGQTCVSIERCYVVDAVYDEFMRHLERAFDNVAAATGDNRDIGPIISPPQIDIIEAHVRDALEKGARVVRGGRRAGVETGGIYYEPTLLVDVNHSMAIMQEETFGPILPVMRVADEAAALAAANDSRYGLHGSVWSASRERGARFASQFRSGTVAVNDVAVNFITPNLAFGGIGDSGFGSTFGPEGLRTFCYPRSITSARLRWPTSALLGARFPRKRPLGYWKALAKGLFRW